MAFANSRTCYFCFKEILPDTRPYYYRLGLEECWDCHRDEFRRAMGEDPEPILSRFEILDIR